MGFCCSGEGIETKFGNQSSLITVVDLNLDPASYTSVRRSVGDGVNDAEDDESAMYDLILKGRYEFHDHSWSHVSPEAKHFVRRLLCVEPSTRMGVEEALAHPWIAERERLEREHRGRRAADPDGVDVVRLSFEWPGDLAFCVALFFLLAFYACVVPYFFEISLWNSD